MLVLYVAPVAGVSDIHSMPNPLYALVIAAGEHFGSIETVAVEAVDVVVDVPQVTVSV